MKEQNKLPDFPFVAMVVGFGTQNGREEFVYFRLEDGRRFKQVLNGTALEGWTKQAPMLGENRLLGVWVELGERPNRELYAEPLHNSFEFDKHHGMNRVRKSIHSYDSWKTELRVPESVLGKNSKLDLYYRQIPERHPLVM